MTPRCTEGTATSTESNDNPTAPSGATEDDEMRDVRGIYNAVVVLADAGRLDLAQEVFDLADEQRVPVEIKGGTHLARLAAEDAIEQAIAKAKGEKA